MTELEPADLHNFIRVRGAKENNLQNISLDIPKRRITAFVGVSGSGKSSLVFETIAAESQRMINETYSAFLQGFMGSLPRPDVDDLSGLTTTIVVDQERIGGNARSTLGTITDINVLLRKLFSMIGSPYIGSAQAFSFNVATASGSGKLSVESSAGTTTENRSFHVQGGMCPHCQGTGRVSDFDLAEIFDGSKSLEEEAILVPGYSMKGWYGKLFRATGFFDMSKPLENYSAEELDQD